jgi:hypothetical protein
MPNIFSCDADWFIKLKDEQPKVIVAVWAGEDEKVNNWLENLQKFEDKGVPVFVCDTRSCPTIAERLGAKEAGETIVFNKGIEKGRIVPTEKIEENIQKLSELVQEEAK